MHQAEESRLRRELEKSKNDATSSAARKQVLSPSLPLSICLPLFALRLTRKQEEAAFQLKVSASKQRELQTALESATAKAKALTEESEEERRELSETLEKERSEKESVSQARMELRPSTVCPRLFALN